MSALLLIVNFLFSVVVGACLLRFWSNYMNVGMQQQPGPFLLALTDWLVMPIRKVLLRSVRAGRWDLGSLCAALLLSVLYAILVQAVVFGTRSGLTGALLGAPKFFLVTLLNTLFYAVLGHAVLSWVQPHSAAYAWLERLIGPFLSPIRRHVPRIGGVDVSGVVLLLAIQVALILVA